MAGWRPEKTDADDSCFSVRQESAAEDVARTPALGGLRMYSLPIVVPCGILLTAPMAQLDSAHSALLTPIGGFRSAGNTEVVCLEWPSGRFSGRHARGQQKARVPGVSRGGLSHGG